MNDRDLSTHERGYLKSADLTWEETLLVLVRILPIESKGNVRLIEGNTYLVGIRLYLKRACLVIVGVKYICIVRHTEERHINSIIACRLHYVDRTLVTEGGNKMTVLRG